MVAIRINVHEIIMMRRWPDNCFIFEADKGFRE